MREHRLPWSFFVLLIVMLVGVPLAVRAWSVTDGDVGLTAAITGGWIAVWLVVVAVARHSGGR